ncbi:bifunctional metallophosphatase/5'-nucleotidase [Streptomyces sp. HNM0575]|uniref:bifunctional metallophosphatase/5'-nucleotidase n=1 Tax=Streptomyces sp. HNM0575 TaxID=2716338 RepID=UPI00145E1F2A|nr:bifunctional metallophosphatase/5'-nucleotidase [Streptomyces sp. HNM0575]NLU74295.1 bifunctional metallophosphatase/5'-nucleotidase [Streptomyces sp. HNM0575]
MTVKPQRRRRLSRLTTGAAALAAAVGVLAAALPAGAESGAAARDGQGKGQHAQGRTVDVQLLSFNDFHGNLEPPAGSSGEVSRQKPDGSTEKVAAGGAEYLATSLRKARKKSPYTVTAAAGDLVGASPLISGLFHDEPTIEAFNKMDLDVAGVGNHEFDEGREELKRLQDGGCHPKDGCSEDGKVFKGSDFPYLAANVTDEKTGRPILKPYTVWKKKGVKIGFIGVTLEGTPDIVSEEGVKGLKFHDEIKTVDKYAKKLDKMGVKSIVALIHEGGLPAKPEYNYDCDSPGNGDGLSGPITDIAKGISPKVDALVTGHTHEAYACTIPDPSGHARTVTSASSFGKLYTDTTLTYDRRSGDIVRTKVKSANHVVSRKQTKAKDMTALVQHWGKLAEPVANRPIGYISDDIDGRGAETPESPLGDVIGDAQLEFMKPEDKGGAQLALMNPGGIRSDLVYKASEEEGDGVVTYGEGFNVQPFTNMMAAIDLTGKQLITALQQQVSGANEKSPKILQVSGGFGYKLDMSKSGKDRVVADSVKLDGKALDPDKTYRVAMNEFLAGGGDGFPVFKDGKDKLVGKSDLEALEAYFKEHSSKSDPLKPPKADRIEVVGK